MIMITRFCELSIWAHNLRQQILGAEWRGSLGCCADSCPQNHALPRRPNWYEPLRHTCYRGKLNANRKGGLTFAARVWACPFARYVKRVHVNPALKLASGEDGRQSQKRWGCPRQFHWPGANMDHASFFVPNSKHNQFILVLIVIILIIRIPNISHTSNHKHSKM
jgi:hypothetical protein